MPPCSQTIGAVSCSCYRADKVKYIDSHKAGLPSLWTIPGIVESTTRDRFSEVGHEARPFANTNTGMNKLHGAT